MCMGPQYLDRGLRLARLPGDAGRPAEPGRALAAGRTRRPRALDGRAVRGRAEGRSHRAPGRRRDGEPHRDRGGQRGVGRGPVAHRPRRARSSPRRSRWCTRCARWCRRSRARPSRSSSPRWARKRPSGAACSWPRAKRAARSACGCAKRASRCEARSRVARGRRFSASPSWRPPERGRRRPRRASPSGSATRRARGCSSSTPTTSACRTRSTAPPSRRWRRAGSRPRASSCPARGSPKSRRWARAHPEADLGIHLALNSEWTTFRWRPLGAGAEVASLVDDQGYFPLVETTVAAKAKAPEVERELRRAGGPRQGRGHPSLPSRLAHGRAVPDRGPVRGLSRTSGKRTGCPCSSAAVRRLADVTMR